MADPRKSVQENISGEFFVDTTCIDCDTCRQLAPAIFDDAGEYSYVKAQPETEAQTRDALRALLACPTGSIGTMHPNAAKDVMSDFPLPLEGDDNTVFYNGFNSPLSYGGNSYSVQHADGNWLIDSPKFLPPLVKKFEAMGGIATIFLTHQDDVAEAERYAKHFGATRIIHKRDAKAQPDAEHIIGGIEPIEFGKDFLIIPTPGHTAGHCVLLYQNKYLFTGDHLSWSRLHQKLRASKDYCWYSWPDQVQSMARLLNYSFEWVLPGHGQRVHLPQKELHIHLETLVQWMEGTLQERKAYSSSP